ncbi:hypothetical protein U1Q18_049696, partial [Sarracenia purpurea var. burkii]
EKLIVPHGSNDKILYDGRVLFLRNIQKNSTGNYTCHADSKKGELNSYPLHVFVKGRAIASGWGKRCNIRISKSSGIPQEYYIEVFWELLLPGDNQERICKRSREYCKDTRTMCKYKFTSYKYA